MSAARKLAIEGVAEVQDAARLAHALGICVVPPMEDGSKRPISQWKAFQSRRPTDPELDAWYGVNRFGIGWVTGAVSGGVTKEDGQVAGGLEVLEFDDRDVYERFRADAARLGLNGVVDRIEEGYSEESGGGGIHWAYRCEVIAGNTKLAERPTPTTSKPRARKALIETRGEGGFVIVAPSCGPVHPSGKPYRMRDGTIETIAVITPEEREELWALARTYDEIPPEDPTQDQRPQSRRSQSSGASVLPGEDFNSRTSWGDVLEGWTPLFTSGTATYWRRPGKDRGHSATTNHGGGDCLHVFTSSSEFEPGKSYTRFGAFARMHYRGNHTEAAKALKERGFGSPPPPRIHQPEITRPASSAPDRQAFELPGLVADNPYAGLSGADLGLIPLDSIVSRAVRWLWKYRLSMGGLAMMAGDGGIGKSQLLLWIAAAITRGWEWADGSGTAPIGGVVIVSAEDRPDETIRPRLLALGADTSRVSICKAQYRVARPGKEPTVQLVSFQDRPYWSRMLDQIPDCRLLIVDPLPSYLGRGVNDSKNTEIRAVLEPFLEEVIAPRDICMLGNTHLNKSADAKTPMHRITGSIAYGNLPRNVHFVVRDPDNPDRRFFKQAKCNNAPDNLPALAFGVETRTVEDGGGEPIETAIPVFEKETVSVDLAEAVNGPRRGTKGPEPKKTNGLAEWLFDYLDSQPAATCLAAVFQAAGEAGKIGKQKPDGKWSGTSTLYDAVKRIPSLPAPRDGRRVEEIENPLKPNGRAIKHWYLCSADALF